MSKPSRRHSSSQNCPLPITLEATPSFSVHLAHSMLCKLPLHGCKHFCIFHSPLQVPNLGVPTTPVNPACATCFLGNLSEPVKQEQVIAPFIHAAATRTRAAVMSHTPACFGIPHAFPGSSLLLFGRLMKLSFLSCRNEVHFPP